MVVQGLQFLIKNNNFLVQNIFNFWSSKPWIKKTEPDPHGPKMLDPDHETNADPKHWNYLSRFSPGQARLDRRDPDSRTVGSRSRPNRKYKRYKNNT